jgi:hypothetical protein
MDKAFFIFVPSIYKLGLSQNFLILSLLPAQNRLFTVITINEKQYGNKSNQDSCHSSI